MILDPPQEMYCSYGDHLSDEYVWHSTDGTISICRDCAERLMKQQEVIDKAFKDLKCEKIKES